MKNNDCPICGLKDYRPFFKIRKYDLVKCRSCSLIFMNSRPSDEKIRGLYNKNYFQQPDEKSYGYIDYIREKNIHEKLFLPRIKKIRNYFPSLGKSPKILDVGCATGFFIEIAKKFGFKAEGVEISKWAASYGKDQLGLKIHTGTINSLKVPRKKFDLLTVWDVIEHVDNLDNFLNASHKLLDKKGKLVLTTPNIQSLVAKVTRKQWFHLAIPFHLYLFSPQTIRKLLERHHFQVIKIESEQNFAGVFEMIMTILRRVTNQKPRDIYGNCKSSKVFEKDQSIHIRTLAKMVLKLIALIIYLPFSTLTFYTKKGELLTVYAIKD